MDSVELFFHPEGDFVRIKCTGLMQVETLLKACDDALADPRYKKGMGRIWDVLNADLSKISTDQVRQITSYLSTRSDDVNYVRVGVVAESSLGFGLARVFATVSEQTAKNDVKPFKTLEDAERWVARGEIDPPPPKNEIFIK